MCSLARAAQMGLNVKDATNCWSSSLPGVTSEKLFSARLLAPQNPAATPLHITYSETHRRLKKKRLRLSKCCSSPLIANVTGKKQISAFFFCMRRKNAKTNSKIHPGNCTDFNSQFLNLPPHPDLHAESLCAQQAKLLLPLPLMHFYDYRGSLL